MTNEFNGYSSRETFDVSLWLNNDYDVYHTCLAMAEDAKEEDYPVYELAKSLEAYWDGYTSPEGKDKSDFIDRVLPIILDVGSLWRVDWHEIAKEFLDV